MPAGTDLITWNPRVGATGDDRYRWPENACIEAGASDYSDPPTIAEINARSGYNQIVAEMRRRDSMYSWGGLNTGGLVRRTLNGAMAYVSPNDRILTGDIKTYVLPDIDIVRANEIFSPFSWSTIDWPRADLQLPFDMRNALASDFIFVPLDKADHNYSTGYLDCYLERKDYDSYPPTALQYVRSGYLSVVGQVHSEGQYYDKLRTYYFFRTPTSLPSIGDAKFQFYFSGLYPTVHQTVCLYRSSSHLPSLTTGDWGNLDNFEDSELSYNLSDGYNVFDIAHSPFSAGSGYTYIFVSQEDIDDNEPAEAKWEIDYLYALYSEFKYPFLKLYTS